MKNVIAFFCGVIMLLSVSLVSRDHFNLENYDKVVLVTEKEIEGCSYIRNGNDFYTTFADNTWQSFVDKSKSVFFYFDEFDFSKFAKSCDEIYRCRDIEENAVYEGFYKEYDKCLLIDGKKENFQLAINGKSAILGFPMIVTGF